MRGTDGTLLFLRIVPDADGHTLVAFGGKGREFKLHKGIPLEIRLKLADLGPGPRLTVSPATEIRAARLFSAVPR